MSEANLNTYFKEARAWADDNFSRIKQSRSRYQAAFLMVSALNILALIIIGMLAHYQTIVPLLVHHYEHGVTTVEAIDNENVPKNRAQVESDIAHYVENREAYESSSFRAQFELVHILSNNNVAKEYSKEQEAGNTVSPIHLLGNHAKREVRIYSINFLDSMLSNANDIHKDHKALAEVVFSLIDTDKNTGKTSYAHYNALISWRYGRPSNSPEVRWKNWDGFEVVRYRKQIRVKETSV